MKIGVDIDLRRAGPIRADDLRALLLNTRESDPRGMRLVGAVVKGNLDLSHAVIPFSLSFIGCALEGLSLDRTAIAGDVVIARTVDGTRSDALDVSKGLSMIGARITGRLALIGARLECRETYALNATGAEIYGGVGCADRPPDAERADDLRDHELYVTGGLCFRLATIGVGLELLNASVASYGDAPALELTRARVDGNVDLFGGKYNGTVDLARAVIRGSVSLRNVSVRGRPGDETVWFSHRRAINLSGCEVVGDCVLGGGQQGHGVDVHGRTTAIRVRIDGQFRVDGRFEAGVAGGAAFDFSGLRCRGSVLLGKAQVLGTVGIDRASIDGRLLLPDEVEHYTAAPTTSTAKAALGETPSTPSSDIPLVSVKNTIVSEVSNWPPGLSIATAGFVYDAVADGDPASGWKRRAKALALATPFDPAAFDTLARAYRLQGFANLSRSVLEQKERAATRRGAYARWHRSARLAEEFLTGYGYRPGRSLAASTIVLVFGAFATTTAPSGDWGSGKSPHRFADVVGWAADTFLPIVDAGPARRFVPTLGLPLLVSWLLIILGWAFSTIVVAAFSSRVFRRRD